MKIVVLPSLLLLIPLFGYCEDTSAPSPVRDIGALSPTSVNPQDTAVQNPANSPQMLINPSYGYTISNTPINKAGIYPLGGKLLVDRSVLVSGSVTTSSITVSSINVTSSLDMGGKKITNIANGTAATDAAAFGQIPAASVFSVVCSSTSTDSTSTTGSTFVATTLGCSGALTNASHHYFVVANGLLEGSGSTSSNAFTAALFYDGSNLDNSIYGQCNLQVTVTGLSLDSVMCPFLGYKTPGDTSSHAFRVYLSAASAPGGGTAILGNGALTMRMVIFEVP